MCHLPVRRVALLVAGSRVDADGPAKLPTPQAAAGWTISPATSSPDFRRTSALVAPPGGVVFLGLEGEHPSGPGRFDPGPEGR